MSSKAKFEPHRGSPFLVQASPGFLESVPDPETPETLYARQEEVMKEELARVLDRLPVIEREAITLWIQGMTQAEIAKRDGVTQAAISIRAKRGIEKLFEMRDSGELGSLKQIWDGLHKIRNHINKEIEMERAADSDTSLPLGEEVGEAIGQPIHINFTDIPAEPRKPAPRRRKPKKCQVVMNTKERAALDAINGFGAPIHIKGIERTAQLTNLEVRNSLRKLVRNGVIVKLGKGKYACQV